ncbi:MAG: VanZ family protein [Peptococcaceae bacterium]|nr:VanZ family protein [Candidatus Syntrophopropionicum ammoniitolerans]
MENTIPTVNSTAREYMHGVVFLVLGLLVYRVLTNRGLTKAKAAAISLAICLVIYNPGLYPQINTNNIRCFKAPSCRTQGPHPGAHAAIPKVHTAIPRVYTALSPGNEFKFKSR